ncbi:glycosyltransferase family 2 protein [Pedobacter miscanthi]|nr:glycosyltransferase [Pedobacter miscanthi]
MPKITVFMAAYNQTNYIKKSIESILSQSFTDFELIVLNDGSTDDTVANVNTFNDERIILVHNESNKGLVFTRNRLLDLAKGEFIAILDSDDIAYPNRLKLQYEFLKSNPNVVLCGGHANVIDENNKKTGQKLNVPVDDNIDLFMLFGNPFVNSTTMFKRTIFNEFLGYREYAPAEDFDLFSRISEKYRIANIDHVLVEYRIHSNNTSFSNSDVLFKQEQKILKNLLNKIGISESGNFADIHIELFKSDYKLKNLNNYLHFFDALKQANGKSNRYDQLRLERFLYQKWLQILGSPNVDMLILNWYFRKEVFTWGNFDLKKFRKAFKKSIKHVFK